MQTTTSIHAPTRGATHANSRTLAISNHFNPRTHEGCDTTDLRNLRRKIYFNPRTHEGCDFVFRINLWSNTRLQSTHPRGVRLLQIMKLICRLTLQSTHPRGVRPAAGEEYGITTITSIHAPTRGATRRNGCLA